MATVRRLRALGQRWPGVCRTFRQPLGRERTRLLHASLSFFLRGGNLTWSAAQHEQTWSAPLVAAEDDLELSPGTLRTRN